jgi:hypothetical protein
MTPADEVSMTATRARIVQIVGKVGLVAAMLAGCVHSEAQTCGDLVCPATMMCAPAGDHCVDADLVVACRGGDDGKPCTVAGLPSATCKAGICQASRCGDGRVTGSEECDGAVFAGGKTCQSLGFYEKDGLRCTADCKLDTSRCVGRCGDGKKNGHEQCDGTDLGGATCFTAGFYAAPGLGCTKDCTFDTSRCGGGRCGDGVINGLEQCDGTKLSTTCFKLGYPGVSTGLFCSAKCTFTAKSCLCGNGVRCKANKEKCVCAKTGCDCVAK